ELVDNVQVGRIKAYLIYQTLNFRRSCPDVFARGAYLPLEATGTRRDHVCAFARADGDEVFLVVVPRLVVRLAGGALRPPLGPAAWGKPRLLLPPHLAGSSYQNIFTGEVISPNYHQGTPGPLLGTVLGRFPVALLRSGAPGLPMGLLPGGGTQVTRGVT